jgi:hypothetical protein
MPRFRRRRAGEEPDLSSLDPSLSVLSEESPDAARRRLERLLTSRLRHALQDTDRLTRRLADAERRLDELEDRLALARADGPGPGPAPSGKAGDADGARLVAARMLGAGYAQGDVEQYLREVYDIPDAGALVEAVRAGARQ